MRNLVCPAFFQIFNYTVQNFFRVTPSIFAIASNDRYKLNQRTDPNNIAHGINRLKVYSLCHRSFVYKKILS